MKTLASMAVACIAMASAVVLSTPGSAEPRNTALKPITTAVNTGVFGAAHEAREGSIELSAQKKKGGKKGGNKGGNRGGNRNANRGHHGGNNNGAAIAAGVLGVIGGLIAADQANKAQQSGDYDDGYYDDEPPPPPRYRGRHCRYGIWIDQDGYEHCRRRPRY